MINMKGARLWEERLVNDRNKPALRTLLWIRSEETQTETFHASSHHQHLVLFAFVNRRLQPRYRRDQQPDKFSLKPNQEPPIVLSSVS